MRVEFIIPVHTVSEANRASHEHWHVRQRRAKDQRGFCALIARTKWRESSSTAVYMGPSVTLTVNRIAPRKLDSHDNHISALKHCVDGLADWLGVKDDDSRVQWKYAEQEKGKRPREYGVRVVIET